MIDQMDDFGFESFVDTSLGFKAYILKSAFSKTNLKDYDVFQKKTY